MAGYEPSMRQERWLFVKVGEVGGRPQYQRLNFNFVTYDDETGEEMLEPINAFGNSKEGLDESDMVDPGRGSTETPLVTKFEIVSGNPFSDVVRFD